MKTKFSKFFVISQKRSISPVIATALLLVVAVIAVVGLSKWFNTYQSLVQVHTEQQSSDKSFNTQIENLVGNTFYFKNEYQNLTIRKVTLGGKDCNISQNVSSGLIEFNLGNGCLIAQNSSSVDLVVYTNKGVFSKAVYLKNFGCSNLKGGKWIKVPGNSALGTSDFCVMKYEAKNEGGVATSEAANTPWVNVTQIKAKIACSTLGIGYHLITNAEWTTIARNIEQVPSNWNSSVVGSGWIYQGHEDGNPNNVLTATTDDSDGYYKTEDNLTSCDGSYIYYPSSSYETTTGLACGGQRRTLYLSNGEVIWDFAGDAWEWNNDTCSVGDPWYNSSAWIDWTNSNLFTERSLAGSANFYTASNGIGLYYGCTLDGNVFIKGGGFAAGPYGGLFALALDSNSTFKEEDIGFRCVYSS